MTIYMTLEFKCRRCGAVITQEADALGETFASIMRHAKMLPFHLHACGWPEPKPGYVTNGVADLIGVTEPAFATEKRV
jgi:hypothetical protein